MLRINQLAYCWLFVFGSLLCDPSIVCCVPNGIFCNDLTPMSLSLEALAVDLPLLGSKWDTVEQLTESSTVRLFAWFRYFKCIRKEVPDVNCTSVLRTRFYTIWSAYSKMKRIPAGRSKEATQFYFYQNQRKSVWNSFTRKLFRVSCVIMCSCFSTIPGEETLYKAVCPDPCANQQSCSTHNCERTGIFAHEYRCECESQQVWDVQVHACIPKRVYQARRKQSALQTHVGVRSCNGNTYCNPNGTLFCREDVGNARTLCACKPQFHGLRCDEQVDACKQRIEHPYLPNGGHFVAGARACNINHDGNTCHQWITVDGDPVYRCVCGSQQWSPDPSLPYDNCLKRRSMCAGVICVHGQCVSSFTGKLPHCVCQSGYSGPTCDEWTGKWTNWSPWDKCRPSCGTVRYSVRSRDCKTARDEAGDMRDCVGTPIEYWRCAKHPCAHDEETFLSAYFSVRQNAIASGFATIAVICGLITVVWAVLFRSTLAEPVNLLVVKVSQWIRQRQARRQGSADDEEPPTSCSQ